jgi:hypothetical protein
VDISGGNVTKQSDFDAKEFCLNLLQSETEEEVIVVLKKHGYWDNRSVWKPYGDMPNNRSIVGNQQSSSVAALVEKLVNSVDAILMAECYRRGIDPKSAQAPKTMREAAEIYFGIKDGRIQTIDTSDRREFAERIQLVATGTKESPAYIIVDDGEGQSPDKFEDTFLSLARENKTKIPFVQGKHNQGGTGVLQFSGVNSFQLIISKRQPYAPSEGSEKWGFTLVRRLDADEYHPQSTYVYLAPNGKILSFDADTLPLRPGKFPYAYEEEVRAGTCIKVWNYKLRKGLKTLATLDLRYALERFLQEPVLPIRICERRSSYKAHYYDTTMSGLAAVLEDNRDDVELSDSSLLRVNGVGDVKLRVVVIKEIMEGNKNDRYPAGIFFVMNGQLHGEESHNYISRKTNLAYVAGSMIVVVDCTDLPSRVREDLFMASRDRMRQIDEKTALEEAIVDYIKDHPGIRELNAIRRQRRQQSALSEEETAKIIQSMVRSDPTLAHLFGKGDLLRVPGKDITEKELFTGQRFPTYFRILNEPKGGLVKHCPKNRPCRVEFETDASNGYFDRIEDQVHVETKGLPQKLSQNLWDGKATLKFGLPASVSVGDEFRVEVLVNDISRLEPFSCVFKIHVEPDAEPGEHHPHPPKGSTLAAIPKVKDVTRPEWGLYKFDEMSALKIDPADETGNVLDIAINIDNIYLRNDIAKRKNIDASLLIYWFKWGLVLLALGMINSEKRRKDNNENNNEENEQEGIYERIERACMGIAATLIPVIYHMGKKDRIDGE